MSNVIVLSDSDESPSPIADELDKIELEIGDEYYSEDINNFDFPEVPFCHEVVQSPTLHGENLRDLNNDDDEQVEELLMFDSKNNRIDKTSRKATVHQKDKTIFREERLKRQQARAREKALKTIDRKALKDMKPGECIKFMEVNLDRGINTIISREEIESMLQNAGIKFNITTELISNSIMWQRNVEKDYIGENNDVCTKRSIQMEQYAIVLWSNYEVVKHIVDGTFCSTVLNNKTLIPNYNMTLVICGMEDYFVYQKKQKSNWNPRNKGSRYNSNHQFDTLPIISREQLEMHLTEIQIVAKCSSRLIENAQDLALMVYQYTKSISEIPYKLQKRRNQEGKFDWYVMGDNKNTVHVNKDGNGLKRLWQQQLCQFNLSSLETSEAICTVYPSPMQLIKAYKNCTPDEGMNLLKDISIRRAAGPLTAARKVGPELSKKMYVMFTSQNGDALLGTEA